MVSSLSKCCLFVYFFSRQEFKYHEKQFKTCFTWHNPILYNFRASPFSKLCKLTKVVFGVEDRRRNKIRLNFAISLFLYFFQSPGEQLVIQGNPPSLYFFQLKVRILLVLSFRQPNMFLFLYCKLLRTSLALKK